MKVSMRYVLSFLLRRPWLGVPFGIWIVFSVYYYWWLVSKINVLESQNRMFQRKLYQDKPIKLNQVMSVDSTNSYQVPEFPDEEGSICETIHLSLVCMGACMQHVTPMLKSLLYNRQNPLHFHLFVDKVSENIMETLFSTWDLPDVKYTLYNVESYISKIAWIPNSHYSGVYPFVKLLHPDVLPNTIRRVIVLDTDITVLCDIAELWRVFMNMTDYQLLGLVENESNWYLEGDRWPAVGRGYNTGVMLLNLHRIRALYKWSSLWQEVTVQHIKKLEKTALGDQDIINAVITKYPHIVYNISCQYNIQLSVKSLAKNCYREDRNNVKIVHWNSPFKYAVDVRDAEYFNDIRDSYVNLDGYLLRNKLHRCSALQTTSVQNQTIQKDPCLSFRMASRTRLRTHIYYTPYSYESQDKFDVTLVLQLSIDRLQFLERLVEYWEGPLSAAIYLADCDVKKLEKFIQVWSPTLKSRTNIGYHLVFKKNTVHYPVNYLRNVALEHVNTPYVFLMDADFVPMTNLYTHLRDAIRLINPYPQKKCLVVPAFETQSYRGSTPSSKRALLSRLIPPCNPKGSKGKGDVAPFRFHVWPRGHRATNYTRWVTATTPYEVEWEADYEPYLVVHNSIPKYDTRFSGFGWNKVSHWPKVSHIVELRALGYRAVVLPDAFVVHTTHAPSADILAFRGNLNYRLCLRIIKQEFIEDLKKKYNSTFVYQEAVEFPMDFKKDHSVLLIPKVRDLFNTYH